MDDTYTGEGMSQNGASGRPLTREPFRGNRIRNRRTGEVRYWIGDRYVGANDPARLTPQDREAIDGARGNANRVMSVMPDLNRFEELNRTVPTGSATQRFGLWAGNMPRVLSIDNNEAEPPAGQQDTPETNSAMGYDEMRAITSRLTPSQRVEGSGSSSNLDVQMFREGLPNAGNTGPANSRIIQGYRRQAQDAQDYADFMEWYWPQTGSLNQAQSHFQQYRQARQANPRLTWREYFGAGQTQQGGGQGSGQGGVERWTRDAQGNLVRQR